MGLPCGSAGKNSSCNVGDLGSIPGLERSLGEDFTSLSQIVKHFHLKFGDQIDGLKM